MGARYYNSGGTSKYYNSEGTRKYYQRKIERTYAEEDPANPTVGDRIEDVAGRQQNLETRIQDAGKDVPEPEKKTNMFLRALRLLDKSRNAVVTGVGDLQTGYGSFGEGLSDGWNRERETYGSDLLANAGVENKWAKMVGGFALDVGLDPLTYASLGIGSLGKGMATGTARTLTADAADAALRTGQRYVPEMVGLASEPTLLKSTTGMTTANEPFVANLISKAWGSPSAAAFAKQYGPQIAASKFKDLNPYDIWKWGNQVDDLPKALLERGGVKDFQKLYGSMDAAEAGGSMLGHIEKELYAQGAGIGAHLPFTNKGIDLVSGAKMQDIGAGINRAWGGATNRLGRTGEVLAGITGGVSKATNRIFNPAGKLAELGQKGQLVYDLGRETRGATNQGNQEVLDSLLTTFKDVKPEDAALVGRHLEGGLPAPGLMKSPEMQAAADDAWRMADEAGHLDHITDPVSGEVTKQLKDMNPGQQQLYDTVDGMRKRWGLEEKEAGLMGNLLANYLPHVRDWAERDSIFRGKRTQQWSVVHANNWKRENAGSIDMINSLLYNRDAQKYGPNFFETTVVKMMMDRGIAHNTVIQAKKFVDSVLPAVGRRLGKSQNLVENEVMVVPKQALKIFEVTASDASKIGSPNPASADYQELSVALKKLLTSSKSALIEVAPGDMQTLGVHIKDLEAWAIPRQVFEYVNQASAKQTDEGLGMVGKAIDSFYRVWKPSVTGMRPGFHLTNLAGATWNNVLDTGFKTLSPRLQAVAADIERGGTGAIKLGGKKYSYDQIRKEMMKNNAVSNFLRTDTTTLTDVTRQKLTHEVAPMTAGKALKEYNPLALWAKGGRKVGNFIEGQVRTTNFLAHLDNGADFRQAAKQTQKYHFDYTELTETERNVLRRAFPFYTWSRKNIPLQLEHFMNKPGTYTAPLKLQDNMQNVGGQDMSDMPDWLAEQLPVPLPYKTEDGRDPYLALSLPYADLSQDTKKWMNNLSPLIKAPIEQYTGQSLLTGAPLENYPGQTEDIGYGMQMKKTNANLLKQFGVLRDISKAGLDTSGGTKDTTVVSPQAPFSFGKVREYSPEAGALTEGYARERQLQNFIQMLQDTGNPVRTMTDINKKGSASISPYPHKASGKYRGSTKMYYAE